MTYEQLELWFSDRDRQASQHPGVRVRSRGEHYRRKNTGIAYRTFLAVRSA